MHETFILLSHTADKLALCIWTTCPSSVVITKPTQPPHTMDSASQTPWTQPPWNSLLFVVCLKLSFPLLPGKLCMCDNHAMRSTAAPPEMTEPVEKLPAFHPICHFILFESSNPHDCFRRCNSDICARCFVADVSGLWAEMSPTTCSVIKHLAKLHEWRQLWGLIDSNRVKVVDCSYCLRAT